MSKRDGWPLDSFVPIKRSLRTENAFLGMLFSLASLRRNPSPLNFFFKMLEENLAILIYSQKGHKKSLLVHFNFPSNFIFTLRSIRYRTNMHLPISTFARKSAIFIIVNENIAGIPDIVKKMRIYPVLLFEFCLITC